MSEEDRVAEYVSRIKALRPAQAEDLLSRALAGAIAEGRMLQAEEDARIAEEGSFPFDIEIWLQATKKEMTERTAKAIAATIRSKAAKIGDSNDQS